MTMTKRYQKVFWLKLFKWHFNMQIFIWRDPK